MSTLTQSPAWQKLVQHQEKLTHASLADLVLGDAQRLQKYQLQLKGLRLNYALQYVNDETLQLLANLAQQQKVEEERARMCRGDKINITENRAVLHMALRQQNDAAVMADGRNVMPDIRATRKRMEDFCNAVRGGVWKGATGKSIKHVVNIGIGGSDLGPRLVVKALTSFGANLTVHFAANADAFDLLSTLGKIDPEETLFVVVSKTFTTQETLMNARTARKWLVAKLGEAAVSKHFVAVSTSKELVEAFGIHAENIFPIWDWVGGRFSLWSAVGLSIMLAIGPENFAQLCAGAAAMDEHFCTAPLLQNMPILVALLGVWQRNFLGTTSLAVLPYSERLIELPRYLQQLDMESNGKTVTRDGDKTDYSTSPILFGECGTFGQHSFHQWLHQGSDKVAVDFIGVTEDDLHQPEHHHVLLANMTAQAGAFAFGRTEAARPQDIYAGGRSSNMMVMDRLDPFHLGLLLALYEHKIFVQGILWNINSFDQPGVELGKQMARELSSPAAPTNPESTFVANILQWIEG